MKKIIGASLIAGLTLAAISPGMVVHSDGVQSQTHNTTVIYSAIRDKDKASTYTMNIPAEMTITEGNTHKVGVTKHDIRPGQQLKIGVTGIDTDKNISLLHTNNTDTLKTKLQKGGVTIGNQEQLQTIIGQGGEKLIDLSFTMPEKNDSTTYGDYSGTIVFTAELADQVPD